MTTTEIQRAARAAGLSAEQFIAQLGGVRRAEDVARAIERQRVRRNREERPKLLERVAAARAKHQPTPTAAREIYAESLDGRSYFRDLAAVGEYQRRGFELDQASAYARASIEAGEADLGSLATARSRLAAVRDITSGEATAFAPGQVPADLSERFAEAARAQAALAPAITLAPLPAYPGKFVRLTKTATGVTVAAQASENASLETTDPDLDTLDVEIATLAGYVDTSLQSLDLGYQTDLALSAELGGAYAAELDRLVAAGLGTSGEPLGMLEASGTVSVSYTDASPTAEEYLAALHELWGKVGTANGRTPTTVALHPRRIAWLRKDLADTSPGMRDVMPEGAELVEAAAIPTERGTGTNEDATLVFDRGHVRAFLSVPRIEAFRSPLSATGGVRVRAYGFVAVASEHRPTAIGKLIGTGQAAPW